MKNLTKLALLALAVLTAACSESSYESYCPTWLGFTMTKGNYPNYTKISPTNFVVSKGDSLHITACQKERGHLINSTNYTWTICYDTLNTSNERVHARKSVTVHTNYDGYVNGSDDPTGHLRIPTNALPTESGKQDTIKFTAQFAYSGQGVTVENGGIVSNTSYGGHITPQSGPAYGGASGYIYFKIQ